MVKYHDNDRVNNDVSCCPSKKQTQGGNKPKDV